VAQPVSIGDGAWGIEVTGNDNGFSLRALAPLLDFIGPHVYPSSDDSVRQHMAAAINCDLSAGFGCPVVLEEFGLSSDFASEHHAADYYRQVLHTTLVAGAEGWLAWNNCDYDDLKDQDPYRHHPFEMHFGVTDRFGQPKATLRELARFSSLVRQLSMEGWSRAPAEVAIVVPEQFECNEPYSTDYRRDLRGILGHAYIVAREADLPVAFAREREGLRAGPRLYLSPSCKLLAAPTVLDLLRLAEEGATVYLSYFGGSTLTQRGPWVPWLDEIFGVRQQLRYGLADVIEGDQAVFAFIEEMGELSAGTELHFHVSGSEGSRAFLPVEPAGARTVAVDGSGRPALLERRVGRGAMVLCTYPIEHMASITPGANPEDTWQLYSALACAAGVSVPLMVNDPRVMVGRLRCGANDIAVVANMSSEHLEVKLLGTDGPSYQRFGADPSAPVEVVTLPPFEVEVLMSGTSRA
jgi:endo-1,4-beta-mannosidase